MRLLRRTAGPAPPRAAAGPGGVSVRQPPATGPALLRLQHDGGNRAVSALLAAAAAARLPVRTPVVAVQRDLTVTWDSLRDAKAAGAAGSKIYTNLMDALRGYWNDKKTPGRDLKPSLTTIETLCENFLRAQQGKNADRADVVAVTKLLGETRADLGKAPPPAAAAAPAVVTVAGLGVAPGELHQRLGWMLQVAQASDAPPKQKEAVAKIKQARAELSVIRARQMASLKSQAGETVDWSRLERASGGEGALSQLLRELFGLFSLLPHGFAGSRGLEQLGAATKQRIAALSIKAGGDAKPYTGFDDVEVILSGSSVTGRALIAKGGATEPRLFGAHSDFDVAVVSAKLFAACQAVAPRSIRDDNLRTEPDPLTEIVTVSTALKELAGRDVSIMVFKTRAAAQRSPGIRIA